mmetsp:Transcript_148397/g.259364  ORF Transcript_148397/g.259364 Transcript_148397/m.259364 type:complete len:116 (-) Transcript_148397:434-781(-)
MFVYTFHCQEYVSGIPVCNVFGSQPDTLTHFLIGRLADPHGFGRHVPSSLLSVAPSSPCTFPKFPRQKATRAIQRPLLRSPCTSSSPPFPQQEDNRASQRPLLRVPCHSCMAHTA